MNARLRASIVVLALAAGVLAPTPVLAAAVPTTLVLSAEPASPGAGMGFCIHATTTVTETGLWVNGGSVALYETTSGSEVYVSTVQYAYGAESTNGVCFATGLSMGTHSYKGYYSHLDVSAFAPSEATLDIEVGQAVPQFFLSVAQGNTVEAHSSLTITVGINDFGIDEQGTLSVFRTGQATPVCSQLLTSSDSYECTVPAPPVGSYNLTAVYSGTTTVAGGTSDPYALTVTPDLVHASGVTTDYTTFYPVIDGYRDKLTIKGSRQEKISVTIRIYSPSGSLIKTQSVASGTGAYAYAWSGRNSAGTIYAEGKYKITQTLKDAFNTTQVYTRYVTLSKKKLVTYTATVTKKGSSYSAKGTSGTGAISTNTTYGYVLTKPGTAGWAGVGWQFTIPTAVIYSSVKFRVYAKHALSVPQTLIGLQNFTTCAYSSSTAWDEGCFDHWQPVGNTYNSLAWYSASGSATSNRHGTIVRGMISNPAFNCYVYKAQVVVVYKLLKY